MSEGFKSIKKRFWIECIVKTAICAVAFGLLASGAVLLGLKLAEININAGFYVLIALGACAVGGGITFLILMPTDKKLAKHLDGKYGLDERIQTMVEYDGKDGAMLEMQRADADEALGGLPPRKIRFKAIWQYIVIAVLSLAVFLTAVCLPAKDDGSGYVPVTDIEKMQFEQLRADVEASELNDGLKQSYLTVLDGFWETVQGGVTLNQRKTAVLSAITFIDNLTTAENTYKKLCAQIVGNETIKSVSDGVVLSVTLYRDNALPVKTYDEVKKRSENLSEKIYNKLFEELTTGDGNLRNALSATKAEGLVELMKECATQFTNSAVLSGVDVENDAFAKSAKDFGAKLLEIAEYTAPDDTDTIYQRDLDSAFTAFCAGASEGLAVQSYNWIMDEFVRERLAGIFDIASGELPQIRYGVDGGTPGYGSNGGNNDEENNNNEGGMGSGDEKFGKDVIFVPEQGYVKLKDVFDEYNSRMLNMLLGGTLTDEAAEIVHMYFRLLQERTGEEEA